MLRENLSINVTPGGVPVIIHISQYDIGLRTFVFSPYTSHGTFTPDAAAAATLEGTKPDGNVIIHNCEYNASTGEITYTVQEQLAAVAGKVWSKLTLRDTSGNAIGYAAIIWMVDMAGVEDGAIASDSDISALQEFIAEFGTINAYKAALDGALAAVGGPYVASTVSQMTDHSKVYVYTGSQTGYTAGHWYYWNGSAWTDGGVYQAAAVETDKTLTVADMAADAKATGDAVAELKNDIAVSASRDKTMTGSLLLQWEPGSIKSTDGTEITSNTSIRTGFISVDGSSGVILNPAGRGFKLFEYDSAKAFLRTYNSSTANKYEYTYGADAAFVRVVIVANGNISDAEYFAFVDAESYDQSYIGSGINDTNNNIVISASRDKTVTGSLLLQWEKGSIKSADGTEISSSTSIRTGFISVDGSSGVILNPAGRSFKLFEYDSQRGFLRTYTSTTATSYNYTFGTDAAYVRITIAANGSVSDAEYFAFVSGDNYVKSYVDYRTDAVNTALLNFESVSIPEWEQGGLYAATGLPYSSQNAVRTDFIDVHDTEFLYISNPGAETWKVYSYDSTQAFIAGNAASDATTGIYRVGKNTHYVRIQGSATGIVPDDMAGFSYVKNGVGGVFKYINENKRKEISILFVGNSLTQDGITYMPYLLKTYYPEINFKFYIWYNGGYTLAQQYTKFINDDVCAIFSVAEDSAAWTNYNNSKKMSDILNDYTFDVVCLQEYFNYKTQYTESDLTDWNNCRDYIQSHYTGGNGLEFITLFHAPLRESADSVFTLTKAGCDLILQKTIAEDMIPNGIAVYRALSTSLDSLGDQGHLSPDGTHTQEGLPCLLQAYANICWLFDRMAINKSIYGIPFKMTTAIYETINVPGANLGTGVIEGTDAQNLLAQEVAIKAYKEAKQMVVQNLYSAS